MSVDFFALTLGRKVGGGSHVTPVPPTPAGLLAQILERTISGEFHDETLEKLGPYALSHCTGMTSVKLENCERIENGALYGCAGLQSVTVPNAAFIGLNAFTNCNAIPELRLGEDVSGAITIEASAFSNCYSLSALYLLSDTLCVLENQNAFNNTPIASTSYTGSYGKIYVPMNLLNSYRSATNWNVYAARFEPIQ